MRITFELERTNAVSVRPRTTAGKKGRQKELVKAYVIEALRKMYPEIKDKERVMKFIKEQRGSSSPKTRDLAACFLDRCE